MGERIRAFGAVVACLLLTACANQTKKTEADLGLLQAWLVGQYDNTEQAHEDAQAGREVHAAQTLTIVPTRIQTFGDHVFYLQESAADDARRVTTQRLLTLDAVEGHIIQRTYALAEPGRWRDGHLNPDLFRSMMQQDATPLVGCDIEWKKEGEKFIGANDVRTCRITSPALGGGAALQMRTELTPDTLDIAELAFGTGGKVLQGIASEPFYKYKKRSGR